MKCVKGIQARLLKTKGKIRSAEFNVTCSALTAMGTPSRSKNECLRESTSAGEERTAKLFSAAETYKKKRGGIKNHIKNK